MQDWTWLKGGSGLNLTRWDPFDDLVGIRETMNRIFDETFAKRGIARLGSGRTWCPSVDMYETEDNVVVRADLPGVNQKDVSSPSLTTPLPSEANRNTRKRSKIKTYTAGEPTATRTLPITTKIKPDQARAEFKNGVLEVIIPKAPEAKGKTYRLDIH